MVDSERDTGVLDPIDRVSEVIFGLLMAMSFLGTLSVATDGGGEVREMFIAALGCNLAWGLADAVMFLIGESTERARRHKLLRALHGQADAAVGSRLVMRVLPPLLAASLDAGDLERVRQRLLTLPLPPKPPRLEWEYYKGAFWIFVLVAGATFPVVLPFLFVDDVARGVRWSHSVGLVTLFVSGWTLSRYSGGNVWFGGVRMAAVGALLMGAIVALGG